MCTSLEDSIEEVTYARGERLRDRIEGGRGKIEEGGYDLEREAEALRGGGGVRVNC